MNNNQTQDTVFQLQEQINFLRFDAITNPEYGLTFKIENQNQIIAADSHGTMPVPNPEKTLKLLKLLAPSGTVFRDIHLMVCAPNEYPWELT